MMLFLRLSMLLVIACLTGCNKDALPAVINDHKYFFKIKVQGTIYGYGYDTIGCDLEPALCAKIDVEACEQDPTFCFLQADASQYINGQRTDTYMEVMSVDYEGDNFTSLLINTNPTCSADNRQGACLAGELFMEGNVGPSYGDMYLNIGEGLYLNFGGGIPKQTGEAYLELKITRFDGVGGLVQGAFKGKMYRNDELQPVPIEGIFSVLRTL